MTKNEVRQGLYNTKIYVAGKSKEIQEKLFELGVTWDIVEIATFRDVKFVDKPFLFIGDDLRLSQGNDMIHFVNHEFTEITADYILGLTWEEENPKLLPFDIEKAKAGAKVVTRERKDVVIFNYNRPSIYSIAAVVAEEERLKIFTPEGKYYDSCSLDSKYDLFLLPDDEPKDEVKELQKIAEEYENELEESVKSREFKPFDRVLWRFKDRSINWQPAQFCNVANAHGQIDSRWEVIPYEGNEHLAYTNSNSE